MGKTLELATSWTYPIFGQPWKTYFVALSIPQYSVFGILPGHMVVTFYIKVTFELYLDIYNIFI